MPTQLLYQILQNRKKLFTALLFCTALLIFINVAVDYAYTLFQNTSFYLSESLLFSSYWCLFLPFLIIVLRRVNATQGVAHKLLTLVVTIAFHLFTYPAFIWLISKIFYSHTFNYWQTFHYGFSAYFLKTILIYGFAFFTYALWNKKATVNAAAKNTQQNFIRTLIVADHANKKLVLNVDDILYFSANSPYVSIYHSTKKYLHAETLKSLETQLDQNQFVRIHKSHIVNLQKISSIQSRQNGDYDLTLADNTVLRVSRNYAKNFKAKLTELPQLTIQ